MAERLPWWGGAVGNGLAVLVPPVVGMRFSFPGHAPSGVAQGVLHFIFQGATVSDLFSLKMTFQHGPSCSPKVEGVRQPVVQFAQ